MNPQTKMKSVLFCAVTLAILAFARDSENAQDVLKRNVAALQKKPGDDNLRRKIIELVAGTNPKPITPPEAAEHEGAAEYKMKNAKNIAGFADAAGEYATASLIAPWIAEAYYNEGLAWEKAGRPQEAFIAYKWYLAAAPDAKDSTDVAKHVGQLRASLEKISRKPVQHESALRVLEGAWEDKGFGTPTGWSNGGEFPRNDEFHYRLDIKGNEILVTRVQDRDGNRFLKGEEAVDYRLKADGRRVNGVMVIFGWNKKTWGTIREDFKELDLFTDYD